MYTCPLFTFSRCDFQVPLFDIARSIQMWPSQFRTQSAEGKWDHPISPTGEVHRSGLGRVVLVTWCSGRSAPAHLLAADTMDIGTNAPRHTTTDRFSVAPGGVSVKVTIVYESMFGNTHEVAQAIGDGVREAHPDVDVQCVPVGEASAEVGSTDLLMVGGPTHIRSMTTGFSRKMGISGEEKAEAKGEPTHELEPDAEGPGLREWFDDLQKIGDGKKAAAFDTRLDSRMAGGAAHGIARRLRRHGYELVSDPEGFVVEDAYGPLRAGEIERAKQWGAQLVQASASRSD